jgi:hypothetical protein
MLILTSETGTFFGQIAVHGFLGVDRTCEVLKVSVQTGRKPPVNSTKT